MFCEQLSEWLYQVLYHAMEIRITVTPRPSHYALGWFCWPLQFLWHGLK